MSKKVILGVLLGLAILGVFGYRFLAIPPQEAVNEEEDLIEIEEEEDASLLDLFGEPTEDTSDDSEEEEAGPKTCTHHMDCPSGTRCYGIPGGAAFCLAYAPSCSRYCGERTCHLAGTDPVRLVCD